MAEADQSCNRDMNSAGLDQLYRDAPPESPRRLLYGLLIAVSVGMVVGRILSATYLIEPWTKK